MGYAVGVNQIESHRRHKSSILFSEDSSALELTYPSDASGKMPELSVVGCSREHQGSQRQLAPLHTETDSGTELSGMHLKSFAGSLDLRGTI